MSIDTIALSSIKMVLHPAKTSQLTMHKDRNEFGISCASINGINGSNIILYYIELVCFFPQKMQMPLFNSSALGLVHLIF
jgi:hypothetical protein